MDDDESLVSISETGGLGLVVRGALGEETGSGGQGQGQHDGLQGALSQPSHTLAPFLELAIAQALW